MSDDGVTMASIGHMRIVCADDEARASIEFFLRRYIGIPDCYTFVSIPVVIDRQHPRRRPGSVWFYDSEGRKLTAGTGKRHRPMLMEADSAAAAEEQS